jgi:hypothetical protein
MIKKMVYLGKGFLKKPELVWDGTGKHPILGKTKEEIVDMNIAVTDTHMNDQAESKDATPQPDIQTETAFQTQRNEENKRLFIENTANNLSDRKS